MSEQITMEEPKIEYAGFWIRVLAAFIDFFALVIPFGLYIYAFFFWKSLPLTLLFLLPMYIYKPFMEMKYGATLGKMAIDVKVVTLDFRLMNLKETLLRFSPWLLSGAISLYALILTMTHPEYQDANGFAEVSMIQQQVVSPFLSLASSLVFLACVIVVPFHPEKRGLHDLLAGTIVVKEKK